MKAIAIFAAVSLVIIAIVGGVMSMMYGAPDERRAIIISGVIAFIVQMFAFSVARLVSRENVIAGWGLGALMRVLVLGVYAVVVVRALGLPSAPALMRSSARSGRCRPARKAGSCGGC